MWIESKQLSRRQFFTWGTGTLAALWAVRGRAESMNASGTTLILGGGFGGIVTARLLRGALPASHKIQLISQSRTFQIGATKTWVMLDLVSPESVTRSLDVLGKSGIEVLNTDIQKIDPESLTVTTAAGNLRGDYLVIALGAGLDMSAVPGLKEAAETFYTRDGAVRLRGVLKEFQGGRIVLLIPKLPFQCPPGPYEAAMLLGSHLRERGLSDKTTIEIHTVEKSPMATAGPEIGAFIKDRLAERGIGYFPQTQVARVDGASKSVVTSDERSIPYDLLIAIPPHNAPAAVRDSGLCGASGWVAADSQTLEMAASPKAGRVFAVGDVNSVALPGRHAPDVPLVLPKAGVFAERQGMVAAGRIAAHVLGREPEEIFGGEGFCYIELGSGQALRGDGNFFALPRPTMTPSESSAALLAEKRAWVDGWMAKYL